jgi:hypothetical protein
MFKNISWSSYGMFILITLVVYYATIGILYYLNEIKRAFSGKSGSLLKLNPSKKFVAKNDIQDQNYCLNKDGFGQHSEESLHALADECMSDVKNTLQYASNNNLVKQEVIYSLQQLLNKYPTIQDTSFKSFITNYILIECVNYFSIHLDEDELKGIWAK